MASVDQYNSRGYKQRQHTVQEVIPGEAGKPVEQRCDTRHELQVLALARAVDRGQHQEHGDDTEQTLGQTDSPLLSEVTLQARVLYASASVGLQANKFYSSQVRFSWINQVVSKVV